METINVLDKQFELLIPEMKIQEAVHRLAARLNEDYFNKEVVFLAILNGTFMFAADLLRQVRLACTISFVKLSSYSGAESSGYVSELIGINENLEGKNIIVLEDIIDTGTTISRFLEVLGTYHPASVSVVTLMLKPEACRESVKPDYVGLEVPNKFVIGYGLDYMGSGRNYPFICSMVSS
jgi:hypoxanthine phosphoribosyltransferase